MSETEKRRETNPSDELGSTRNEISQTKSSFKNVILYLETFENVVESVKRNLFEIKDSLVTHFEQNDFVPFDTNGKFLLYLLS